MIQAVPALAMTIGTFACVTTGASAIADGENTKPVRICTLSLVIKLGSDGFCLRAGRRAFVTLDDLDFVRRDVLGVKLHVKVESLVDLVTEVGIGAAERKHHTDLDGLGLGGSAHGESHGGYPEPPKLSASHSSLQVLK